MSNGHKIIKEIYHNFDFNQKHCHSGGLTSGVPRIFFRGEGVQQLQLTEGRENRDLGAVAP
jgi:hypothetical protein